MSFELQFERSTEDGDEVSHLMLFTSHCRRVMDASANATDANVLEENAGIPSLDQSRFKLDGLTKRSYFPLISSQ